MGFSIGNFFSSIFGHKSTQQKATDYIRNYSASNLQDAASSDLIMRAGSMLKVAKELRAADPSKLSASDRAQLQSSLQEFAQTWKSRSPAEYTIRAQPSITDNKTGAVKDWTAPFDSVMTPEGDLSPQSWSSALQYLVNDAPAKFGFAPLGKLSVQISPTQTDSFDPPKGSVPKPADLRVDIRFQ